MNLHFKLDEEGDILNTTIRDSGTGPVVYIIETPRCTEGTVATTVMKRNQADGSTRFSFKILWKGAKRALEDVSVVLDSLTLEEVPVRQVLESSPGAATYGSVRIDDVEYRWKSKGTGSKVVLVDRTTNKTAAESHSRIRGNFFRKPRDMSLETSATISHAIDVVLLTFILVWMERQNERSKTFNMIQANVTAIPLSPLPVED